MSEFLQWCIYVRKKSSCLTLFTLRPSRVQAPLKNKKRAAVATFKPSVRSIELKNAQKKSRCCDSSFWCERRDLASAAAVPCMLMARRPSQATVPGSPLLAKNSPQDCFLTLRPSRVQVPLKVKKSRRCDASFFGARDGT